MDIIIYGSLHGAAKRYADGLAETTGIKVLDYKKAKSLDPYKRVIYIGLIYAGGITGLKKTVARLVPGQEFFLHVDLSTLAPIAGSLQNGIERHARWQKGKHPTAEGIKSFIQEGSLYLYTEQDVIIGAMALTMYQGEDYHAIEWSQIA